MNRNVIPFHTPTGEPSISIPTSSLVAKLFSRTKLRVAATSVREYSTGDALFREGERPKGMLLLLAGDVKLSMNSAEGRRLILRVAKAGESLDISSTIAGTPHTATAEAVSACTLMLVDREIFLSHIQADRGAMELIMRELSGEVYQACQRLQIMGGSTVESKLARILLDWALQGIRNPEGVRLHNQLSHREIGEFIGAARESVTRKLAEFQRRSILSISGTTLIIRNMRALEDAAGIPRVDDAERACLGVEIADGVCLERV